MARSFYMTGVGLALALGGCADGASFERSYRLMQTARPAPGGGLEVAATRTRARAGRVASRTELTEPTAALRRAEVARTAWRQDKPSYEPAYRFGDGRATADPQTTASGRTGAPSPR